MKALDFLKQLTSENLDMEQCGTANGENINIIGTSRYFGCEGKAVVKFDKDYFYFYGEEDYFFSFLSQPNITLPTETGSVYLWEIE